MKLSDFICFDAIVANLQATDRDTAITELISSLKDTGKLDGIDADELGKAVISRENEASTGIGKGVAVPHVKHQAIKDVIAVVGNTSQGIDFASLDKQPVYSVMLLLSPQDKPDKHLQAMENIFKNLQQDDFRRFLRQAETPEQIKEAITDQDSSND